MNDPLEPPALPDSLRLALGEVDPPSAERREAALAAAMAAYDEMFAGPPTAMPAPATADAARVIDLAARRRRGARLLAAAAAVVVIAGGALAINQFSGDSNDNSNSASKVLVTERAPAAAVPPAGGAPAPTIDAPGDATATQEAAPSQGAPVTSAASSRSASDQGPAPTIGPIEGPAEVLSATTPEELAALAARLTPNQAPAGLTCLPAGSTYLGSIYYRGAPAVLITNGSMLEALAADGCAVLASIRG